MMVRFHSVTAHAYCSKRAHPFAVVSLPGHTVILPLDHLHLGVLLNDGSVGGSEHEETRNRKSADEVSHTISVSTSALLAF